MKVLTITGDKKFVAGNLRFDLQSSHVERLVPIYWGSGSLWPSIPKEQFDVITVQDPFWRGLFAWFIARKKRIRFNVQVHTDLSAQSFSRRMIARIVLSRAHSIRVVSEKIKKQVETIGVLAPIYVLPVYINVNLFRSLKREPNEQKTILWIGRFEAEKDPVYAIDIFKKVRKTCVDTKLIMLGLGSLEETLRRRAKGSTVEFPGWVDVKLYLKIADVVLCTSRHESWGASIVEALLAGVPVVSPDVGIAKESGARVVQREKLAEAIINVLKSDLKVIGKLQLHLIEDPKKWAEAWIKTL